MPITLLILLFFFLGIAALIGGLVKKKSWVTLLGSFALLVCLVFIWLLGQALSTM